MSTFAGTCPSGQEYDAGCTSCQLDHYKDNGLSWETQFEPCTQCPNGTRTLAYGATRVASCILGISANSK